MGRRKRMYRQIRAFCGEIHEDDGVDPREYFRSQPRRGRNLRKTRQLCRQVADTLTLVLSGECRDEVLQGLYVVAVDPAPDASRLMVTVQAAMPDEEVSPAEIFESLARETGRLRCEVAGAITRKRTPKLAFQVLGPDGVLTIGRS